MGKSQFVRTVKSHWHDVDFKGLSQSSRLLERYLATGPHVNALGAYRLPLYVMAGDTGFHDSELHLLLPEIQAAGFIIRGGDWFFIVNHLKSNPVKSALHANAAYQQAAEIPTGNFIHPHVIARVMHIFGNWPTIRARELLGNIGGQVVPLTRGLSGVPKES